MKRKKVAELKMIKRQHLEALSNKRGSKPKGVVLPPLVEKVFDIIDLYEMSPIDSETLTNNWKTDKYINAAVKALESGNKEEACKIIHECVVENSFFFGVPDEILGLND